MALLFISNSDDPVAWQHELAARVDDLDFRVWPEAGAAEDIGAAMVWKPEPGVLAGYPNLKLIQSLGMGVDHIFCDPDLPKGVPIARLVDPDMANQMSEWVLLEVLRHHRKLDDYARLQREHRWHGLGLPDTSAATVGVMGLGALGAETARRLHAVGFPVIGWSRSPKTIDGVESFDGADGLAPFLDKTKFLICLLPLTPDTENIIDAATLAALPEGAVVINSARGGHVVEEDLLTAIDSGHIAGATLDVFRTEPLPEDHPFWDHPKVRIYPHISAITNPKTAADQVAENFRNLRAGRPFLNVVDPDRGY